MKMTLTGKDLISTKDLTREDYEYIFEITKRIEGRNAQGLTHVLPDRIIALLFFEPSTRTRLSFSTAVKRLGGETIGFSGEEATSIMKGENLADTIRVVEQYADAIVIRHPLEGSAKYAAQVANIPVINAGSGAEEHPTQALLDLYTILREKGTIDELTIGLIGDLRYSRTVHSLLYALTNFDVTVYLISPPLLKLGESIKGHLHEKGVHFKEFDNLADCISELDVLYVTRIQRERFVHPEEYLKVKDSYKVNMKTLSNAKENLIVMHPLPRVGEISHEVDNTSHAVYFKQVRYGLYVRMAILSMIFGREDRITG